MDLFESNSIYETRLKSKQRQDLLVAIETIDLENGRKLILDNSVPITNVQPALLTRFLWHVVKVADSILLDELLTYNPDLTTPKEYTESMLWLAVKNCDIASTRLLIIAGADLTEKSLSDPNQPSFLHAVIMWWHRKHDIDTAILMIQHGADVNARDAKGNSVLHTAMLYDVDVILVDKLLENGADVHAVNDNGYDLLLTAVCSMNAEGLLPKLVGYGVDEVTKKRKLMTALQYLIFTSDNRKLNAVRRLLRMDVMIDSLDDGGLALLHWAVSIGGTEVVKILLNFGADINIRSFGGTIPLIESAKLQSSFIARLLIKRGADIQMRHVDGRLPLHAACAEASHQNIHLFLQLGADLNAVDTNGRTPFSYLQFKQANSVCVILILEHLALLEVRNGNIHEVNRAIIESNNSVKNYYESCLSELHKIKDTKIYGDTSLFCFFSKSFIELSRLIRNEDVVKNFKSFDQSSFPHYIIQLEYAFAIAEKAKAILDYNENILSHIFHGILSHVVVKKIAAYLYYDKLKNLQRDFYFSLHESINQGETN